MNDSVLDMSSGNVQWLAEHRYVVLPDTIIPEASFRWEFVGDIHVGTSVLSINENDLEDSLALIYPNPATTNFIIDNVPKGHGSIAIYNIYGQPFFATEHINESITINVENWPTGQYVIWINHRPMQLLSVIH